MRRTAGGWREWREKRWHDGLLQRKALKIKGFVGSVPRGYVGSVPRECHGINRS